MLRNPGHPRTAQLNELPECVILGANEAAAEHLCNRSAPANREFANFSSDLAIFFTFNNEFVFGCTSVCANRSEKPRAFASAVVRQLCRGVDWVPLLVGVQ